jgi:hypothetical protein
VVTPRLFIRESSSISGNESGNESMNCWSRRWVAILQPIRPDPMAKMMPTPVISRHTTFGRRSSIVTLSLPIEGEKGEGGGGDI